MLNDSRPRSESLSLVGVTWENEPSAQLIEVVVVARKSLPAPTTLDNPVPLAGMCGSGGTVTQRTSCQALIGYWALKQPMPGRGLASIWVCQTFTASALSSEARSGLVGSVLRPSPQATVTTSNDIDVASRQRRLEEFMKPPRLGLTLAWQCAARALNDIPVDSRSLLRRGASSVVCPRSAPLNPT